MAQDKVQLIIAALDQTKGAFQGVDSSLKALQSKAEKAGAALSSAFSGLGAAFAGTAILAGITAITKASIEAGLAMERLTMQMQSAVGANAAREMGFVREESDRLGLSFRDTAEAYAKFSAAARNTSLEGENTRKVFIGVAEATTALKLSTDEQKGIFLALSQMISKGTVQAEELRGQLGERLPGAFNLAAKAMGVTTAELGKMLQAGQVAAGDLLPKLAEELHKTYGQSATQAAEGATASINRFNNALFDTKEALGTALMPAFTSVLNNAIKPALDYLRDFIGGLEILAVKAAAMPDKIKAYGKVFFSGKGLVTKQGKEALEKELAPILEAERRAIEEIIDKYSSASSSKTQSDLAAEAATSAQRLAAELAGKGKGKATSSKAAAYNEDNDPHIIALRARWRGLQQTLDAERKAADEEEELLRRQAETFSDYMMDIEIARKTGIEKDLAAVDKWLYEAALAVGGGEKEVTALTEEWSRRRAEIKEKYAKQALEAETEVQQAQIGFLNGMMGGFQNYIDTAQKSYDQGADFAESAAYSMKYSFKDFFDYTSDGFLNLGQAFTNMLDSMASKLMDFAASNAVTWLLEAVGAGIGGSFGAIDLDTLSVSANGAIPQYKHSGGLIMHSGGFVPRFHLGTDEVPAILQTQERVLSRSQNKTFDELSSVLIALKKGASGGSGEGQIIINNYNTIQAMDSQSFQKFAEKNNGAIASAFSKNADRGGVAKNAVRKAQRR